MATQHGNAAQNASTWTEPPWSGWIETTGDALLILEAARRGLIPRVTRRLVDSERKMITSGSVFVFDEDESGIKRWTDGFFWSPSRILGNFLLYRETDKRGAGHRPGKESEISEFDSTKPDGSLSRPKSDPGHPGVDKHRERTLVGSLTNSYKFKPDGLMKKTFSLTIGGVAQHLISYYRIEDVESGRLRPPSSLPELASLEISAEYLDKTHFRNPPKVEMGADGILRYRGEADDIDTSASLLAAPLTGLPLLTGGREVPESSASKRIKRFEPYGQPNVPTPKRQRKTTTAKTVPGSADGSQVQSDVMTSPNASPTSPHEVPTPPVFADPNAPNTPPPAAPAASYSSFGVSPYYGYMQPPPHMAMYPHQPGYPLSPTQPMPPPPNTHPGQYSYASYPPPATAPNPQSASTATNASVSSPDPSHSQSSSITTSPPQSQPPTNPPMQPQPQPGYYHPHPPHPYYPPPPHTSPPAPGAPPHHHPQMYPGYPPPSHAPAHSAPSAGVWGPPPPHPHPHPYGTYAPHPPPPPGSHPQQAPPPPPQSYSYPYPAPPPQQQQQPPAAPHGQYQQPYHAQQAQYVQSYGAYATQKPDQAPQEDSEVLKANGTSAGRDGDGEKDGGGE